MMMSKIEKKFEEIDNRLIMLESNVQLLMAEIKGLKEAKVEKGLKPEPCTGEKTTKKKGKK